MTTLGLALYSIGGLAGLVCFILVLVAIFQHGQTGLGILCIVLAFCGGIGSLIAFIYGWVKCTEWRLKNIMLIWTGAYVLIIIGISLAGVPNLQWRP